ncbi:MAG TPA: GNAT family N-acetyltransferase [Actinomycetota bacterium]|nr:GNAT family N-acetyltransferase [Actinomycetota bacterium]
MAPDSGTVATDGELVLRRLRDDPEDYASMGRWLSDERVLEFYGGRDAPLDPTRAAADYLETTGPDGPTFGCVIELDARPIGYVQFYRWLDHPEDAARIGMTEPGAYGIDLFIGEPELWGRGLGTRTVELVVRHLVEERAAMLMTLDPLTTNARAIRAYEKAGFRKDRIVTDTQLHEGEHRDLWLMVRTEPRR